MSQQKVDENKRRKANRNQIMKREWMFSIGRRAVMGLITVLLLVWIGVSGYGKYYQSIPWETVEVNFNPVQDYFLDLSEDDEEEEAEAEETETAEEAEQE